MWACRKDEIDFLAAGINHMAWFLKLEHEGRDLYPQLKANFEKPGYYVNEKVRAEVMRHFGYFMTESTGHLSEYLPYFRKNKTGAGPVLRRTGFRRGVRRLLQILRDARRKFARTDPLSIESTKLGPRSAEYCSHIIEAKETGELFRLNGNIRNDGYHHEFATRDAASKCRFSWTALGLHPTVVGTCPFSAPRST